ncbi:hypothetical protein HHK36_031964 [Tetracentron sinense]|uniref:Uncharacterized protein n=1 Tax=Tetracentron sinense TaxID=13715 RepID=A0A835D000_TETSI|nr:hypothetical protein HHK36_031964 [Tetracentron sinense]
MDMCKPKGCRDLISLVFQMKKENRESEVFDPFMYDKKHDKEMLRVLEIACCCLNKCPKMRPSTQQLVSWLDNIDLDGKGLVGGDGEHAQVVTNNNTGGSSLSAIPAMISFPFPPGQKPSPTPHPTFTLSFRGQLMRNVATAATVPISPSPPAIFCRRSYPLSHTFPESRNPHLRSSVSSPTYERPIIITSSGRCYSFSYPSCYIHRQELHCPRLLPHNSSGSPSSPPPLLCSRPVVGSSHPHNLFTFVADLIFYNTSNFIMSSFLSRLSPASYLGCVSIYHFSGHLLDDRKPVGADGWSLCSSAKLRWRALSLVPFLLSVISRALFITSSGISDAKPRPLTPSPASSIAYKLQRCGGAWCLSANSPARPSGTPLVY